MNRNNRIKLFVVWISIIILSGIILNNSLFVHVHKLESGKLITHAHPFTKADTNDRGEAKHKHSCSEIEIYQILNSSSFTVLLFLGIAIAFLFIRTEIAFYTIPYFYLKLIYGFKIRPPPAFV